MIETMEFIADGRETKVWIEDDLRNYEDRIIGVIKFDPEGFYRFYPKSDVAMTHKHLRTLSSKVGEMNS